MRYVRAIRVMHCGRMIHRTRSPKRFPSTEGYSSLVRDWELLRRFAASASFVASCIDFLGLGPCASWRPSSLISAAAALCCSLNTGIGRILATCVFPRLFFDDGGRFLECCP